MPKMKDDIKRDFFKELCQHNEELNTDIALVQRIINECGNIKYVGSSKSGHWEIVD